MDAEALMTDLEPWLSVIGSTCVIVGTVFVVIKLRMNAKQVEESGAKFSILSPDQHGVEDIYWPNFKWLAEQNLAWINARATGQTR
jgi:hypothetical protein